MTMPAMSMSFEVDGVDGLWGPDWQSGNFAEGLVRDERPFAPWDFAGWFHREVSEREPRSWLARTLRITQGPSHVSTAVGFPVRVRVSPDGLRRRWVAFSSADTDRLGALAPPQSTRDAAVVDCCLFRFEPTEAPFTLARTIELHAARPSSDDLHCFVDRESPRRLHLIPTPGGVAIDLGTTR